MGPRTAGIGPNVEVRKGFHSKSENWNIEGRNREGFTQVNLFLRSCFFIFFLMIFHFWNYVFKFQHSRDLQELYTQTKTTYGPKRSFACDNEGLTTFQDTYQHTRSLDSRQLKSFNKSSGMKRLKYYLTTSCIAIPAKSFPVGGRGEWCCSEILYGRTHG